MLQAIAAIALLGPSTAPVPRVDVKITQKYLIPVCLNGAPIKAHERRWRLAVRPHAASFTMGSDSGQADRIVSGEPEWSDSACPAGASPAAPSQ